MDNFKILQERMNNIALDEIKKIIEYVGPDVDTSILKEKLDSGKVVVVENNIQDCIKKFGSEDEIPSACGGRCYNDGLIHIFPFKQFEQNKTIEQIIENYTKFVIPHEIFHYIIRLDIKSDEGNDLECDCSHFINEGMVQHLTELYRGYKSKNVGYRNNVDFATELYEALQEAGLKNNIFNKNMFDAIKGSYNIKYVLQSYNYYINRLLEVQKIVMSTAVNNGFDLTTTLMNKALSVSITKLSDDEIKDMVINYINHKTNNETEKKNL